MPKPKLAVFKFASCDGCQLSLLDAEDELLAVADAVEIAYFLEARTREIPGPYDIGLVEGSVTTAHDAERIRQIRKQCTTLVTIGACATAGGIQALKNWAKVDDFIAAVYASPEYITTLATSTPISEHVMVDFELRGCPINKRQLIELVASLLQGVRPRLPRYSVCMECKRRRTVCVAVAQGIACLGPGHSGRLRRHLPFLQPGVFRLLRAQGATQPGELDRHVRPDQRRPRHLLRLTRNFNGYCP